jgi:carboxypeptidase Taq
VDATLTELKDRLGEIADLNETMDLLGWDQRTIMPPGGAAARAERLATLTRIAHERLTSADLGRLLDAAAAIEARLPADSDEASLIRVGRRDREKALRVPVDLLAEMRRAASEGYAVWVEARRASDFAAFGPVLERQLALKRRYVECFDVAEPYDALLDDFEPGMKAAEVRAVFDRVKAALGPLVATIAARADRVREAPFLGRFPVEEQRRLARAVAERLGFDPQHWRLDPTVHPFASSPAITDIRITTRYNEGDLRMALFGTMHETGHGLYERGVSPTLERTPLARGASLALHESQSGTWEKMVGRGRPFWRFCLPLLRRHFPEAFAAVDEETIYRAANKMAPSLIRVEADEATYSLHIILRFELEQELIEGRLPVKDLPDAWNDRVRAYLGIDVPSDAQGVLQDVHWSSGNFGYFPTYALGNILAAQIWERFVADVPDVDAQFAAGEFGALREWLRERIHQHGRKFTPQETVVRAVGRPLDPEPFVGYITAKVEDLYGPVTVAK